MVGENLRSGEVNSNAEAWNFLQREQSHEQSYDERKNLIKNDLDEKIGLVEAGFENGEAYDEMLDGVLKAMDNDRAFDGGKIKYNENGLVIDSVIDAFDPGNAGEKLICNTVVNTVFDCLGIAEDKRPLVEVMSCKDGQLKYERGKTRLKAEFFTPKKEYRDTMNGKIRLDSYNFKEDENIEDKISSVLHECYHAYQYNVMRGTAEADEGVSEAYAYDREHFVDYKTDFMAYSKSLYEESARYFAKRLRPIFADILVASAKIATGMERRSA